MYLFQSGRRKPIPAPESWRAAAIVTALFLAALGGYSTVSDQLAAPADAPLREKQASLGVHDSEEGVFREVRDLKMTLQSLRQDLERTAHSLSHQQNQALLQIERTDRVSQDASTNFARLAAQVEQVEQRLARPAAGTRSSAPAERPTITADTQTPKPTVQPRKDKGKNGYVEGWVLREVNDGLALVESPAAGLFGVRVGNTVPGVGRVESVERRGKKWVVVTNSGTIGAAH